MNKRRLTAIIILILAILFFASFSVFGKEIPDGFSEYIIKSGDSLKKIAPEAQWDIIMRVNKMDFHRLHPGKMILIPTDPNIIPDFFPVPKFIEEAKEHSRSVHVFLDIQYFGAYENGGLVFWGPISSGKSKYGTPRGIFNISWKSKNYYSRKYKAKMPFALNLSGSAIFFHQQLLPGFPASHGCLRLLRSDAEKLFHWTKKDDFVYII